ncbi:MAG TPA: hypothetical protein VK742_12750 [Candidatus Sulfotelmatobacter sp.]|nr:hypothetical protein [Candidatus Sulfotelmatobacter sp.]
MGLGQNKALVMLAGLLILLMVGAGMVCSVLALCAIGSSGRKGLLVPGVLGVLLNSVWAVVFMVGFIQGYQRAMANRHGMQQMYNASRELTQKAGDDFNPTSGISGQAELKKMDQLRSRLNSLTNQLTGEDAEMMDGLNACLANWTAAEKKFIVASTEFQKAEVLNFKTLGSKEQLADREQAVQTFLDANEQFRTALLNQDQDLESELVSRKISAQKLDQFMAGFRSTHEPLLSRVARIRDCDKLVGNDCFQILGLAEKQWGNWTADPVERILFNDEKVQVSSKMLVDDINYQAGKELNLQREVIQLQRSSRKTDLN